MKILVTDLLDPIKQQKAIDGAISKAVYHHRAIDPSRIIDIMKPWSKLVIDHTAEGQWYLVVVDLRDVDVETFNPLICQQSPMGAVGRFKELYPDLFQKDKV